MEARRCATHGLVLGDDGRCVICRRGEVELKAATSTDLPVVLFVAIFGIAAVGLLGYSLSKRLVGYVVDPGATPAVAAPAEAPPEVQPPPPGPAPPPRRSEDFPAAAEPEEPPAEVELTEDEVTALKRKVPITMYARSDCRLCDAARTWIKGRGYRLAELNVETSPTDKVVLESLNPAGTMPTFVIDGKTLIGYDRVVFEERLEAAARKRAPKARP